MIRPRLSHLLLICSVMILLVGFIVWLSWAVGPIFAVVPLVFTIWFGLYSRKTDPSSIKIQKRIHITVLILAGTVASLFVAYMSWVSSYTF
ncbi:MAG: hypothetical protein ABI716_03770 [Candidatus Saccharibacteria bacterium]